MSFDPRAGAYVAFGAPSAPIDLSEERRFQPTPDGHAAPGFDGGYRPWIGWMTWAHNDYIREASPTGKPMQSLRIGKEPSMSLVSALPQSKGYPDPRYPGWGSIAAQGYIDPWAVISMQSGNPVSPVIQWTP